MTEDTQSSLILRTGKRVLRIFLCTCLIPMLSACTTTYAPVEQRTIKPYDSRDYYTKYNRIPDYYKVRAGDTLYSIAWNYGLDYKSLARWNNIRSPYTIHAGKKLHLKVGKSSAYTSGTADIHARQSKLKKNTAPGRKSVTRTKNTHSKTVSTTKSSQSHSGNSKKKPQHNNKHQSQKTYKVTTVSKTTSNDKKKTSNTSSRKSADFNKSLSWSWPVKGKLLQSFAPAKGKKGIDIVAREGTPIKAAESGKVVYSGQGLRGYGLLLIIKHNETFLSAYAHNQSLLINEGQIVKKGQTIARLGNTGTDRNKLHFEIRKNGQPVNPLSYLP